MKTLIYNGPLGSGHAEHEGECVPFEHGDMVEMSDEMADALLEQNPEFWSEAE